MLRKAKRKLLFKKAEDKFYLFGRREEKGFKRTYLNIKQFKNFLFWTVMASYFVIVAVALPILLKAKSVFYG